MRPVLDPESKTVRTQIVSPQKLIDRIDDWRRVQKGIPSKSEAIRELIERGLDGDERGQLLSYGEWKRIAEVVGHEGVERFVREAIERALRDRERDLDALSAPIER